MTVDEQSTNPIVVWTAFQSIPEVAELAGFAITLLKVVANQGGIERTFSDLKVKQTQHRARLGLVKLAKMHSVSHPIKCLCINLITDQHGYQSPAPITWSREEKRQVQCP